MKFVRFYKKEVYELIIYMLNHNHTNTDMQDYYIFMNKYSLEDTLKASSILFELLENIEDK